MVSGEWSIVLSSQLSAQHLRLFRKHFASRFIDGCLAASLLTNLGQTSVFVSAATAATAATAIIVVV